jgi:hypothetical protein
MIIISDPGQGLLGWNRFKPVLLSIILKKSRKAQNAGYKCTHAALCCAGFE